MLTRAQFKQIDRLAVGAKSPMQPDPRNIVMNVALGLGILILLFFVYCILNIIGR